MEAKYGSRKDKITWTRHELNCRSDATRFQGKGVTVPDGPFVVDEPANEEELLRLRGGRAVAPEDGPSSSSSEGETSNDSESSPANSKIEVPGSSSSLGLTAATASVLGGMTTMFGQGALSSLLQGYRYGGT